MSGLGFKRRGTLSWFRGFIDCLCLFLHFKICIFSYKVSSFFFFFSIHVSYVVKRDSNLLKMLFTLYFLYSPLSPWLSSCQAFRCWRSSIFNYSCWAAILFILNTSCNILSYLVCACVCFSRLTINRFKLENIIILHVTFQSTIVLERTKTYPIYNNTVKPRRITSIPYFTPVSVKIYPVWQRSLLVF